MKASQGLCVDYDDRITGKAFGWLETGTEGAIWAPQQDRVEDYGDLVVIAAGNCLKAYTSEPDEQQLFQGIIGPVFHTAKISSPSLN